MDGRGCLLESLNCEASYLPCHPPPPSPARSPALLIRLLPLLRKLQSNLCEQAGKHGLLFSAFVLLTITFFFSFLAAAYQTWLAGKSLKSSLAFLPRAGVSFNAALLFPHSLCKTFFPPFLPVSAADKTFSSAVALFIPRER